MPRHVYPSAYEMLHDSSPNEDPLRAIETLRAAVRWANNQAESVFEGMCVAQILRLYSAAQRSEWDFPVSKWTQLQIMRAIRSDLCEAPMWDENEQPVYGPKRRKVLGQ